MQKSLKKVMVRDDIYIEVVQICEVLSDVLAREVESDFYIVLSEFE